MKSPVVLLHTDAAEPARAVLMRHHGDLEVHTCDNYERLADKIAETGAEAVYSVRFGKGAFPRDALLQAPSVKWVSVGGSGTDHLIPWDTGRLTVTNSAGVAADMMAQYALGAMLHFSLQMPAYRAAQARREWGIPALVEPIDGKTVLILGLGQTGQAVARRCKAMGLTTLGVRARPKPTENVDEVHGMAALPVLWGRADFVVCCVPLLDSTQGLVDAAGIAALKPEAVIIDVSRGGVIEEAALVAALREGRIRGAALDVFPVEPLPADHPYWGFDNVIVTPHSSAVYEGWDLKSVEMFSENLTRYRRGEALSNIVDPERGY